MTGEFIGRYKILRHLDKGGMGDVFLGWDTFLERRVALKSLREEQSFNEVAKSRFVREARALSKMDHPNICKAYDIVQKGNKDYLVLEFIEGLTLNDFIRLNKPTFDQKMDLAIQLIEGLAVAHSLDIVHRDLKPHNIMITVDGLVKILDFGLSKMPAWEEQEQLEETINFLAEGDEKYIHQTISGDLTSYMGKTIDLTETEQSNKDKKPHDSSGSWEDNSFENLNKNLTNNAILGTPSFMAPEQVKHEEISTATDIFSLGVVFYELFNGELPFDREIKTIWQEIDHENIRPFTEGFNKLLADLIMHMLEKNPINRPKSKEISQLLKDIVEAPKRRKRKFTFIIGLIVIPSLIIGSIFISYKVFTPDLLLEPGQKGRIAFLPFKNNTGIAKYNWVELGLMDMVSSTINDIEGLDVVPYKDVEKVLKNIKKENSLSTFYSRQNLKRIGKSLGAEIVIDVSITQELKQNYKLHYQLFNLKGFLGTKTITGNELTETANIMASRIMMRLKPDAILIDIKDKFSDDPLANQLYAMGISSLETDGAKKAQHYFEICLDKDPNMLWANYRLGMTKYRLQMWDQHIKIMKQVLELSKENNVHQLSGMALNDLGLSAMKKGSWDLAKKYLNSALEIYKTRGNLSDLARGFNSLGANEYKQGHLKNAEFYFEKAIDNYRLDQNKQGLAKLLYNSAVLKMKTGTKKEVKQLIFEAMKINQEIGDQRQIGLNSLMLGWLESLSENYSQSIQYAQKALDLGLVLEDKEIEINSYNNLGFVSLLQKDWIQAESWFKKVQLLCFYDEETCAKASLGLIEIDLHKGLNIELLQGRLTSHKRVLKNNFYILDIESQLLFEYKNKTGAIEILKNAKKQFPFEWTYRHEKRLNKYINNVDGA